MVAHSGVATRAPVAVERRPVPRMQALVRGDRGAVLLLLALTLLSQWETLRRPDKFIEGDHALFFVPMYSFLGERLRAGDIPGWNPHQFAGAPFAGDPQSGWTYLPAMLLFTFFPLAVAVASFVVLHLALAGVATYAFGRALGLGVVGALVAGVVYEFTVVWERSKCCPQITQVMAWLPAALLAGELAIQARSWWARIGWWIAAGFAVSQILASWLGQGSYYMLLVFGAYLAYRTLVAPPDAYRHGRWSQRVGGRVGALAMHGAASLGIGLALAAAGLVPRLEYNARSNVPGGEYRGVEAAWSADFGGWSPTELVHQVLGGYAGGEWWYAGGAALALAVLAPVVARRWFATPFFVILAVGLLVLALRERTPLHALLFAVLPRFDVIHGHYQERITYPLTLPVALLAGSTVGYLPRWGGRRALLAALALLPAAVVLGANLVDGGDPNVAWTTQVAIVAASALVALGALLPGATAWRLIPAALLLVLFWDPAGRVLSTGSVGGHRQHEPAVDLPTLAARNGAAGFLADAPGGPFRYVGYDPQRLGPELAQTGGYLLWSSSPETVALLLVNRATLLGLDDVQGYNPVHPARYVEYMTAMNGQPQVYRFTNVYPPGIASPLLDLLNVRYFVVPAEVEQERGRVAPARQATDRFGREPERSREREQETEAAEQDLQRVIDAYPTVYEDDEVRVLENREALPRAWIVHEARQVAAGEALPLLARGGVDPRRTVLLEGAVPELAAPPDPAADEAVVLAHEPDRFTVRTRTAAPGMLVLSEIYDPSWRVTVDGEETELVEANHVFGAVPVPAGEHRVEARYESPTLRLGTAVSLGTAATIAGFGIAAAMRRRRHPASEEAGLGAGDAVTTQPVEGGPGR